MKNQSLVSADEFITVKEYFKVLLDASEAERV